MTTILLISLGGMAGAVSRYWVSKAVKVRRIPLSTMTVNLVGAFMLGLLAGKGIDQRLYILAATGFLGAFTTFSTLNVELVKMISSKQIKEASLYFIGTYAGGGLSVIAGMIIGRML